MAETTTDAFFNGNITVSQPRNGYRFSIDAILLAAAHHPKSGQKIVDLGTGCGIIPLILARRHPDLRIFGVEMQPDLADLARSNVERNRMADRIRILQTDMRKLSPGQIDGPADLVMSNPPYRKAESGRINPNAQRAIARHEIHLTLEQLLQTVRRILRTGGRFLTIYPAERTVDLLDLMRDNDLEPKRMTAIHSRRSESAKLILVHGIMRGNSGLIVDPPLIIYNDDGAYSNEVQAILDA
jgi:tRNA1Val (adenine37-N6)-methyltransferase